MRSCYSAPEKKQFSYLNIALSDSVLKKRKNRNFISSSSALLLLPSALPRREILQFDCCGEFTFSAIGHLNSNQCSIWSCCIARIVPTRCEWKQRNKMQFMSDNNRIHIWILHSALCDCGCRVFGIETRCHCDKWAVHDSEELQVYSVQVAERSTMEKACSMTEEIWQWASMLNGPKDSASVAIRPRLVIGITEVVTGAVAANWQTMPFKSYPTLQNWHFCECKL